MLPLPGCGGRAPELLLELSKGDESDPTGHTIYTEAVDVWSVGCIMVLPHPHPPLNVFSPPFFFYLSFFLNSHSFYLSFLLLLIFLF